LYFRAQGPADGYGALSPLGDEVAVCCGSGPPASVPGSFQGIIGPDGNVPITVNGRWWDPGWIDETHLAIRVSPRTTSSRIPPHSPTRFSSMTWYRGP
ncbi:MAG TPA: hypothetical protein VJO72_05630, partial [Candidatus Dormibacteraeota bacterium]|nr:hypothetical protein [Candidatus Dormibacteraeota bacterium]